MAGETASATLHRGETIELDVTRMAHGGEGIGFAPDGRVVFVGGALPGERVRAEISRAKKRWARASLVEVTQPSALRVAPACPAAARGAGCCDYSHIEPGAQLGFKREVVLGQLSVLAQRSGVLDGFNPGDGLSDRQLQPVTGWRTRVRLGVDAEGRAGTRMLRSTELVTDVACAQAVPGLLDGIVGEGARRFTPGAEVVVVRDGSGQRHIVESSRAQRGRRVERIDTVIEGGGTVTEHVGEHTFTFPATAFWQAHVEAPAAYAALVEEWGQAPYARPVGWDLYGGVGVFVPFIDAAIGGGHVDTVDYSAAASGPQESLAGLDVTRHNRKVEAGVADLAEPGLVVLDPPRSGAGAEVIGAVASARPERIIHVGCDPATFARDLGTWGEKGYRVTRMELIDAFPGTHHFETVALLEPRGASEPAERVEPA